MSNKNVKTLSPKLDVVFQAKDDKLGVLDILAELDGKEKCNIELQIVDKKNIIERVLFYWSRLYSKQIKAGEDYDVLQKTIVILITNFKIENLEELNYHSTWQIMETKSSKKIILTKKLEIDIIELPKIEGKEKVKDELLDWLYFLEEPKGERVTKNMEENEELKEAVEKLDSLSADERMQRIAELREKAIMDEKAIYARGKQIGAREIAKELLNKDMTIEEIIRITGLTKEEIEKVDDLTKEERKQRIAELREKAIMDEKAIYARGKQIGAREIAKELLNKNMTIEEIIRITGLTKEEIEKVDDLTKDERMQRIAELREKAIMDEKAIYAKGLDAGGIEEKRKIAKELLSLGVDIEIIAKSTGLTNEEIEKLKYN